MKISIPQPTDWLVVFLVLNSYDVERSMGQVIKQLESTKLKPSNKIYFLLDRITNIKYPDSKRPYGLFLQELVHDSKLGTTSLRAIPLPAIDPTDGFAWRDVLIQLCTQHMARLSTLITWSHGSGIGINNPGLNSFVVKKNPFNLIRNFDKLAQGFDRNKFECGITLERNNALIITAMREEEDCQQIHDLYISEISNGLKGKHFFDLAIMCNCYTQMVDNCYNFHDIARFYIAPITLIQLTGYDFARFINAINGTSMQESSRFNELTELFYEPTPDFKDRYYEEYFKLLAGILLDGFVAMEPSTSRQAALFANDLLHIRKIREHLNNICHFFMTNCSVVYPVLENIVEDSDTRFSTKDHVDLVHFFEIIDRRLASSAFSALNAALNRFLRQEILVDARIGEALPENAFHCFSIYIPLSKDDELDSVFCCQYFRGVSGSVFVKETVWDNFVDHFTHWRTPDSPTYHVC